MAEKRRHVAGRVLAEVAARSRPRSSERTVTDRAKLRAVGFDRVLITDKHD